jgi:hypothetical protein
MLHEDFEFQIGTSRVVWGDTCQEQGAGMDQSRTAGKRPGYDPRLSSSSTVDLAHYLYIYCNDTIPRACSLNVEMH